MKFDGEDDIRFTRSVSEFNRQMEELMATRNEQPYGLNYHNACQRVRDLRERVRDIRRPKSERQPLFDELRSLESFWGLESREYNHG